MGEDAHRTFKKRHMFRSMIREPQTRSRDAFATRFAKEVPAGPTNKTTKKRGDADDDPDNLFNSDSDEEYLSALDAEEESRNTPENTALAQRRNMMNTGRQNDVGDTRKQALASPHASIGLYSRPPPDAADMGRGARMKSRAESVKKLPRPGGGPLGEFPKWLLETPGIRQSPAPWIHSAVIDRGEPSKVETSTLAGMVRTDPATGTRISPAAQQVTKSPGSALLNKLRIKKAAKASSESDSACDLSARKENTTEDVTDGDGLPRKREPKRDQEVSDLLLDQDPRGRAVRAVKSVFDIDNLHPALSKFLQGQGVDAPKPLQGNFDPGQ